MKHTFLRFLSVLLVLTLSLNLLHAVPAYRGWRTMTQPDGTTITIRQMGDEFFHYWENEDGQQVEEDEQGYWRVLEKPAVPNELQKKLRASRRYNQTEPGKPHKVGGINLAPRGLVILVNFTDVTFKSANTRAAMSELMNSTNYTYNTATGSVREFFKAQSNGKYVPNFDVVGPYDLAYNRAHYGANSGGSDVLAADMVIEACKAADADGVDFTLYNNDGDTYVDFVYVIYAGVGEADANPKVANAIWPHNWTISSARYYNQCSYTASQCKVDNLTINNYACSGEMEGTNTYRCPIGTITHEFGHVLGLPDYYVTDEDASNYGKKYTPGAWHIMDYGSYNNEGRTPPNYTPHDKYFFGWSTPTLLAKDEKKNCTLTTTYGSAYQINGGTTLKAATASSRVWYLEDRQKSGWDEYLPGHGMVVWEVTYNSTNWDGNEPNNETVGYTVVTANSLTRPYTPCVYNTTASSTSGTPFPGTGTVTSWTPATGCALTDITESAGNITFKYNGGVTKTECEYIFDVENCTASPASGTISINNPLSATVTPNSGYSLDDESCWLVEMGGVLLTYGTDFTYNASNNTFTIPELTDDVYIVASAKLVRTVTWSVNGSTSTIPASTFADGAALVLPSTPSDCSGDGGKKFVGWTAQSSVSGSAPADLFTEAGTKTVTANITYYAVYATASGSGGASAFDGSTAGDYKIYADVSGTKYYAQGTGSKISSTTNAAEATVYTFEKVSGGWAISTGGTYITYSGSTNLGTASSAYTWTIVTGTNGTWRINSGTSGRGWIYRAGTTNKFGGYSTGNATSSSTEYFDVEISGGAGTSYSDYSLICGTPCSNTPVMSFTEPTTVAKTTADVSFTKTVTITGKGSGQTVAYSSSDETVATVNNSGVVTLQGKVGSTTITASVEANGTYCAASASYTLNVSAAPINVTLYYNGTSAILNNQTPPYTLPTTGAYVADMCDGDWTFAGWYNNTYDKNTTAPTYITQLTATGSAYAVYTTTETSGGGGSSATTISAGDFSSVETGNEIGTQTISGITVTGAQNTHGSMGPKYYSGSPNTIRCYVGNKLTISASGTISQIDFTYNDSYSGGIITTSDGAWESTPSTDWDQTWKGSASSIDFTIGGTAQWRITAIKVTVGGGGSSTTYYATTPDCSTPPATDYTVTWKACGETFHTQGFADGAALVLPASTPADNAGKTFVGWTATEHYTGSSAPADLFTNAGSKTVTADVTYYAVFH